MTSLQRDSVRSASQVILTALWIASLGVGILLLNNVMVAFVSSALFMTCIIKDDRIVDFVGRLLYEARRSPGNAALDQYIAEEKRKLDAILGSFDAYRQEKLREQDAVEFRAFMEKRANPTEW